MKSLKNGVEIGGWLLTCNPRTWDLPGFLASGVAVESWRLAATYRAAMVEPGDRCFLWLADSTGRWTSGVWGVGYVTDRARLGRGADSPYWIDEKERRKERPYIGVMLSFLDPPIARADLLHEPGFREAEVLRVAQMGNPSVLRPDEVALLDGYLAEYSGVPVIRKLPPWGAPRRREAVSGE